MEDEDGHCFGEGKSTDEDLDSPLVRSFFPFLDKSWLTILV